MGIFDRSRSYTIKARSNGKYVCREDDGLKANRDYAAAWERFKIQNGRVIDRKNASWLRTDLDGLSSNLSRHTSFAIERVDRIGWSFRTGTSRYGPISGKRYVVAEPSGVMACNRTAVGPWETFDLERMPNATNDTNYILEERDFSLRGRAGYMCAQPDGSLVANRSMRGPWESFIVTGGDAVVYYGRTIALMGVWLMFVGAYPDGRTDAEGFGVSDWQQWVLVNPDDPSSTAAIPNAGKVAIRSVTHGKYMYGPMDGSVRTTAGAIGAGEIWTIENF